VKNIKEKAGESPIMPYLGVNLSDLTFTEDGNPTYVPSGIEGVTAINFSKFRLVSKILANILLFQKMPYDFKIEPKTYAWLRKGIPTCDDNEMYELSKQCEPSNRTGGTVTSVDQVKNN